MRVLALSKQTGGDGQDRVRLGRGERDLQHGDEQEHAGIEGGERWTKADELSPCPGSGDVEGSKGDDQDV